MSALEAHILTLPPPALPPLRPEETQIDFINPYPGPTLSRPASLSSRQSLIYNNETGTPEDFHTIPLHETAPVVPPHDERRETILITCLSILAFIAFCGALVVCILLSLSHGPGMDAPVPMLLFAMSAFLVISGVLIAKSMSLWLHKRDRKNARKSEMVQEKVDDQIKNPIGSPQLNGFDRNVMGQQSFNQV